jgi:purine-cytosine permease-like protein
MMSKKAALDVAERIVRTFVATFLGLYLPVILGADKLSALVDLSTADKAAAAGVASVVTLVLGLLGTQVKDKDTGSVL